MSTYLATISTVPIEQGIIEKEEELVEWKPVKKLDTSRKLVCQTCPYEDLFQNINDDIEEMKRTVSEVYALQDKKQDKKKNKVKDIHIDIQEDINKDEDVVIKNVKNKLVKQKKEVYDKPRNNNKQIKKNNNRNDKQGRPKKEVYDKYRKNSRQIKKNNKSNESKNLRFNNKIFNYFKIKIRKKT